MYLYLCWLWRKWTRPRFFFSFEQWIRCRNECMDILREQEENEGAK
jgi:hypothetical protein